MTKSYSNDVLYVSSIKFKANSNAFSLFSKQVSIKNKPILTLFFKKKTKKRVVNRVF